MAGNATRIKTRKKDEKGLALITVLAVIAILSILVLEFSSSVLVDLDISSNFRDRTQAEYNARAGLQYAIKVLRDDDPVVDSLQDPWAEPHEIFIGDLIKHYKDVDDEEDEESYFDEEEKPEPVDKDLGKAYILIIDEERKLNINRIMANTLVPSPEYREIVESLLRNLDYPELDVENLVENIIDWIDDNDDGTAEESTYYEHLEKPYEPKSAPINSIYEMLLIKDMSRMILFGNKPFPLQESGSEDEEEEQYDYDRYEYEDFDQDEMTIYGLCNFITPYTRRQSNVNTAPREVFMALLDDQEMLVDEIIERRLEGPFDRYLDLRLILETVSKDYYNLKSKYFTIRSRNFWVESIGEFGNARVRFLALLQRAGRNEVKILYQRIENMRIDEDIHFIGDAAKYRRR